MLVFDKFFFCKILGFFFFFIYKLECLFVMLGVEVWVKCDDVFLGLVFGGNKICKLEWLVVDVLVKGCDILVLIGNIQFNYMCQVCVVVVVVGMKFYIVQEIWLEWDDLVYDKVGNIFLICIMGGNLIMGGYGYFIIEKDIWVCVLEEVCVKGGKFYVILVGVLDYLLGGLGYVNFVDEVVMQEQQLGIFFDNIVVVICIGFIQVGMVVGFVVQEKCCCVIGIDIVDDEVMICCVVIKIVNDISELIVVKGGKCVVVCDVDIEIIFDYSGLVYGLLSEQIIVVICIVVEMEVMLIDLVYEGKFIDGLIDMVKKGYFKGQCVLYVYFGGVLVLNVYYKVFEDLENLIKLVCEVCYKE